MTVENTALKQSKKKFKSPLLKTHLKVRSAMTSLSVIPIGKQAHQQAKSNREAEDRARYLEAVAMQKEQELQYREQSVLQAQTVLRKKGKRSKLRKPDR